MLSGAFIGTTRKVVSVPDCDEHKHVLGIGDYFAEHRRHDVAPLQLLCRVLSFWYKDAVRFKSRQEHTETVEPNAAVGGGLL